MEGVHSSSRVVSVRGSSLTSSSSLSMPKAANNESVKLIEGFAFSSIFSVGSVSAISVTEGFFSSSISLLGSSTSS